MPSLAEIMAAIATLQQVGISLPQVGAPAMEFPAAQQPAVRPSRKGRKGRKAATSRKARSAKPKARKYTADQYAIAQWQPGQPCPSCTLNGLQNATKPVATPVDGGFKLTWTNCGHGFGVDQQGVPNWRKRIYGR